MLAAVPPSHARFLLGQGLAALALDQIVVGDIPITVLNASPLLPHVAM